MISAIVTGGAGFVGNYLVSELLSAGYDVTLIIRNRNSIEQIKNKHQEYCSMDRIHFICSNLESLRVDDFKQRKYDVWIHTAWNGVNREQINSLEIHQSNFGISQQCIYMAEKLGCTLFCDTGSRAECGNKECVISEYTQGTPLNIYGKMKKEFYHFALSFSEKSSMKYLHFRLFSIIGVGDHPWSVVMTACSHFLKNDIFELGSCEQMWNFMDVRDVAKSIRLLVEKVVDKEVYIAIDNRIVNVANFQSRKLCDYIKEIHKICNCQIPIVFGENVGFDSNPETNRLRSLLPQIEQISFSDSIYDIVKSMK